MQLKGKVFYLIPTLREKLFKNRERKGSLSKNPGMIELTDFGGERGCVKESEQQVSRGMRGL